MINSESEIFDSLPNTQNNFLKNFSHLKSEKYNSKKDIIFDEGAHLLSQILKPFAFNLEKLFCNLIERKIHLKFVSINFEMPSYIANEDKYVELFQKNLFLFLEKISAVRPKHNNIDFKDIRIKNFGEVNGKIDDTATAAENQSILSDLLRRRTLENTKKKLSFFALNNLNLYPNSNNNKNNNNKDSNSSNNGSNNSRKDLNYNVDDAKNNNNNESNSAAVNNKNYNDNLVLNHSESDAAASASKILLTENANEKNNQSDKLSLLKLEVINLSFNSQNKPNAEKDAQLCKKPKTIIDNLADPELASVKSLSIPSLKCVNYENNLTPNKYKNQTDFHSNSVKEMISPINNKWIPIKHHSQFNIVPAIFTTPITYKEKSFKFVH